MIIKLIVSYILAGMNAGLNNIGSLLNTTGAPNVSLSRTNLPSDAQLSPNFAQTLMQQQLSPGRSAPYSPQPNQGMLIMNMSLII